MPLNCVRSKSWIWGVLGFIFVAALAGYYAFVTRNCLAYPWWFQQSSDGDGTYVAQTLTLINNGNLSLLFHPGATVYAIHGFIYRILIFFFPAYHSFVQLDQMAGPGAVFAMLDQAMRTSRVISYVLNMAGLLILWRLLFQLTKSGWLAYFLAAFFMTSRSLMHIREINIRPELGSFLFAVLMFSWVLSLKERPKAASTATALLGCVVVGLWGGLAGLAKLQVMPQVLCIALVWICSRTPFTEFADKPKTARLALAAALANLAIMPWGWLKRPDFLPEYLKNLNPLREEHNLYGAAPATWEPVFLTVLGVLAAATLIVFLKNKSLPLAVASGFLKLNLLATGMILSCYLVLLPLGMKWGAYLDASNHMVYASICTSISGGALNHKVIDWTTFKNIIELHDLSSRILGISILWFVLAATIGSIVRLVRGTTGSRRPYIITLVFFAIGVLTDISSSFRQYTQSREIISSYAIYSLLPHVCGLGVWIAQESALFAKRFKGLNLLRAGVCALLAVHLLVLAVFILRLPKADGSSEGTSPTDEMLNVSAAVPHFWYIVSHGQVGGLH